MHLVCPATSQPGEKWLERRNHIGAVAPIQLVLSNRAQFETALSYPVENNSMSPPDLGAPQCVNCTHWPYGIFSATTLPSSGFSPAAKKRSSWTSVAPLPISSGNGFI